MAHEEAGVPVEAAASLFGVGDETASDFFSTGFDSVPLVEAHSPPKSTSLQDTNAAATLFEAGPDEATPSLFVQTSHDHCAGPENHHTGIEGQPQLEYNSSGHQDQRWQDNRGQWHNHGFQNGYTPTYDYASQQSTGAYAPQVNYPSQLYGYAQRSPDYSVPAASQPPFQSSSQHDYSQPYTPRQPSQHPPNHQPTYASSHIVARSATHPHNSYKPYSPAITANVAPHIAQSIKSQNTSSKSDITVYRPTTLNAYDPPILTKTRPKGRSAFSSAPTPYSPFYGTPVQPVSAPPPPPSGSRGNNDFPSPSSSIASGKVYESKATSLGPAGWSQEQESSASPPGEGIYEGNMNETQQLSSDLESEGPLGSLVEESAVLLPQQGDFSHDTVEAQNDPVGRGLPNEEAGPSSDYEAISQRDPEGDFPSSTPAVVAHPLDWSLYPSSLEPSHVYSPDDQPFPNDHEPSNASTHTTITPSSQIVSPVELEKQALQVNGRPDIQPTDDPYHPTLHSRINADESHTGSTFSPAEHAPSIPWNPYAPPTAPQPPWNPAAPHDIYDAHGSYGASSDSRSALHDPPYTTPSQPHRLKSRPSDLSNSGEYPAPYHHSDVTSLHGGSEATSDLDHTVGSVHSLMTTTYAQYAPSPSLLGTNDPLGRAAARVPVISFGFGGKLVSCFHSAGQVSSGYDVSLTSRRSTEVQLHILHEVIPASAMDSSASSYPGPLFSDPGTSSISLARTVGVGMASNVKAKKALVSKWLEERVYEISNGVAYKPPTSQERFNAEGRLVLVRLLKAMLDNDGQLSGSPSIEWTVRTALVPRLESERLPSVDGPSSTDIPKYTASLPDLNETPLAVYHLRASALDRIQEFLLRGERHQAYHYALDEKLWAHAMLIASSIDNQAWREVVTEFLHSELAPKQVLDPSPGLKPNSVSTNGRESLRVAYSLFAGHGAAAVQELIPTRAMPPIHKESLLNLQPGLHITPVSPNFPQPAFTSSVPPEVLSKWHETAAMMAFSHATGDSAALTALGDYLAANRRFEAAHACYLLSPRTSSFGGAGIPSVRVVLVGSESPSVLCTFSKDLDVTLFSEIVEFALSLSPSKGQETFTGLPHLQAYKLIRAAHLAEMGYVEVANRYCEAIGSVIRASTRASPFYTQTFIGELKNLSDRLTAAPQLDKTASWISSKLSKPSLDTIGSWLEGRFSKLIVGESEGVQEPEMSEQAQPSKEGYGPFSHYSTISSTTTSASPSPSPTSYRSSEMGTKTIAPSAPFSVHGSGVQIDRASSAMDHLRPQARRTSPVPRVASASATTTTFAQASNPSIPYSQGYGAVSNVPESGGAGNTDNQEVTWWGSNSLDGNGPTPTATTFYKVDEGQLNGDFVSPMDSQSTTPFQPLRSQSKNETIEEEDDLGLGNSSKKPHKPDDKDASGTEAASTSEPVSGTTQENPELKQKSSWFGRWWSRSSGPASSGPIKAKLGEETSFYYDKELKRWVNKKAGGSDAAPPTPPPPSRPRTASPAPGGPLPAKATNGPPVGPPPTRPASAAETSLPSRKPPRVRSNLAPTEESATPGSPPPPSTGSDAAKAGLGLAPPSGINRPKSSASKRNVRNRYVDVLQQQGET